MSQPYVGEIRMVGFQFCTGGLGILAVGSSALPENDTLFNLIGTTTAAMGRNLWAAQPAKPIRSIAGQGLGVELAAG